MDYVTRNFNGNLSNYTMKLNRLFIRSVFSLLRNLHLLRVIRLLFGIVLTLAISFPLHGQKKFYKAIRKGNLDAVSSYISRGGDLNQGYEDLLYDSYYGGKDSYYFNPMEYAAFFQQTEVLRLIMQHKESITGYQTCLDKAFGASISSGNMEVIRLLIDAGADINAECGFCYGQSAIQIALEYSNFELVEELMKHGANLQVSSDMGRTLLHGVAHSDNILLAGKLIDSGLDVNVKDEDGATPILFAASNGKFEMFKLFEEYEAELLVVENNGNDLMMNAAIGGNVELIGYLFDRGISVNSYNNDDWTPLLFACSENHQGIVEILINASADIQIYNNQGETPLLWAIWNGNTIMARTLIEAGTDLQNMYDYRKYAKKNIKDKSFLLYLENKYSQLDSELLG